MIEAGGQVRLEMGMGSDGDLVGIIKRIIQASSSTPTSNTLNCSISVPPRADSPIVNLSNGCQLDVSLINSLTEDQLNNLLNDEEKFRKFMTNFQSIMDQQVEFMAEMKNEAKERASANIELKKEIDGLARRLDEVQDQYSQSCQSYQNFMALNSTAISSLNPENVLTQIQVNLMELNDSTNQSIRSALNSEDYSNLDLELKECIKMRKEYHKKAILLQKYQE